MKTIFLSAVLLGAVVASAADPVVSNVRVSQSADRRVTISYDLADAPVARKLADVVEALA